TMKLFPAYIHAWTQSDRLAIAGCFQLNGFDFFHPCNYNLITKEGVTAVDFPIHEYIVALISYCFSLDLVVTFRFYTLLYGLVGLYFVYRFFKLITGSYLKGIALLLFVLTAPFYSYYLNGFLPSVPSFS